MYRRELRKGRRDQALLADVSLLYVCLVCVPEVFALDQTQSVIAVSFKYGKQVATPTGIVFHRVTSGNVQVLVKWKREELGVSQDVVAVIAVLAVMMVTAVTVVLAVMMVTAVTVVAAVVYIGYSSVASTYGDA